MTTVPIETQIFDKLPRDVVNELFDRLKVEDLIRLSLVSKKLKSLVNNYAEKKINESFFADFASKPEKLSYIGYYKELLFQKKLMRLFENLEHQSENNEKINAFLAYLLLVNPKSSKVAILIENGASVEAAEELLENLKSQPPEQLADSIWKVTNNNIFLFFLLVKLGVDINDPDESGNTHLMEAVKNANQFVVNFLLACNDIDPNHRNIKGESALHYAVKSDNLKILQALLSHTDTNVNVIDKEGNSALHIAIADNKVANVKALLAHKDINIYLKNKKKVSIMSTAALQGNVEVEQLLLNCANLAENELRDFNLFKEFISAIKENNVSKVEDLLNKNELDINDINIDDDSLLSYAAKRRLSKIFLLLLNHKSTKVSNLKIDNTILFSIFFFSDLDMLKAMLSNPEVAVKVKREMDKTILDILVGERVSEEFFDFLISENLLATNNHFNLKNIICGIDVGSMRYEKLLYNDKIDINLIIDSGKTVLIKAIENNNTELVKVLLKHPNIDVNFGNGLALKNAVNERYSEIVALLLAHKNINLDITDGLCKELLVLAFTGYKDGKEQTLKTLLNDKRIRRFINAKYNSGEPFLNSFICHCKDEVIAEIFELYQTEIDINAQDKEYGYAALHDVIFNRKILAAEQILKIKGVDVNVRDKDGRTPLIHAIKRRQVKIVRLLLAHPETDINAQDNSTNTAFIYAEDVEIVNLLLQHENININYENKYGACALSVAAWRRNRAVADALLSRNTIDIEVKANFEDINKLIRAVRSNNSTTTKKILAKNPKLVNIRDETGATLLMEAACFGHLETTKVILACKNLLINLSNSSNSNALFMTLENKQLEVLQEILKHPEIDLNHKDKNGNTVLMDAVYYQLDDIVKTLLADSRMNLLLTNNDNLTALDLARELKRNEIVKLLEEAICTGKNAAKQEAKIVEVESLVVASFTPQYNNEGKNLEQDSLKQENKNINHKRLNS